MDAKIPFRSLVIADRYIREVSAKIDLQRQLVAQLEEEGGDAALARRSLKSMISALEALKARRDDLRLSLAFGDRKGESDNRLDSGSRSLGVANQTDTDVSYSVQRLG
ncbi:hypothetical protein CYJ10_24495 [Cupriavidus pauculus]|uniref:Uncharacterized protein n=1 Tax=Cupriavidus pauculus TaxID=82633 RepID=A0A2N5C6U4_9BURK|nr:hypothetical protein CYJ10_24495 [Cupriavidus pauculus]